MEKKYSLHKLWFYYTDEWHCPSGLGPGVGVFSTLEQAETEKRRLDRQSLKNLRSTDYIRDLTYFYETTAEQTIPKIVAFAQSQNWQQSLRERPTGNNQTYWELSLPSDATAEQMDALLQLTNASFHKVIAYNDVKEYSYVKLNNSFRGKKAFDQFKADGLLEPRNPTINGEQQKGLYLIHKPLKGRKVSKIPSTTLARQMAVKTFLDGVAAFPDTTFLGKTYIGEWSYEPELLRAYLAGCTSIVLHTTVVGPENIKAFTAALKKKKSFVTLSEGMLYFESVEFKPFEEAYVNEILGLAELLREKPFVINDLIAEINGEVVEDYKREGGLL